jgi:hypothetical protein
MALDSSNRTDLRDDSYKQPPITHLFLGFVQGYCGLSGLRTPAGRWGRWSRMSSGGVLVDCRRRLCAAVAICTLELQCGDAMLTTGTFEERTAVYRFGRVISHVYSSPLVGTIRNQKG